MSKVCAKKTEKKYTDRPSPPYPANECPGATKKGNDGNKYKSIADRNGIFRWKLHADAKKSPTHSSKADGTQRSKPSKSPTKKPRRVKRATSPVSVRNGLEKLWGTLAEGGAVILVYKDGTRKMIESSLRTPLGRRNATFKVIDDAQEDSQVRAILSAARSYDGFERLERKAKGKSVEEVLDNWQKYWTSKIDSKLRSL